MFASFAHPALSVGATGVPENLSLSHTVLAILLNRVVLEEEAIVIEGEAVRTKEGDKLTSSCISAQSPALLQVYSTIGVDVRARTGLAGSIIQCALSRLPVCQA